MTDSATQKRLKFLNRHQLKFSTPDALALFALGTFALHLLTFFLLVLLYGAYSTLSKKEPPSLVQLQDGKSIKAIPLGSRERTPQVVTRFINDTMILMMNASGSLPATTPEEAREPKIDSGVDIRAVGNGRSKVTTAAWQASAALSEDFRKEFLKLLADTTPQGVFKGTTQMVLTPLSIQPPVKIAEGKWKVKMVANLTVFDRRNNLGEIIPFNKEIFVQAVEAPDPPVQMTGLTAVIYGVRSSGLEIYAIRDTSEENL
ncbi:MAG: hypothetical protein KME46_21555 [Brasilonema angustatum HA4187-MV1]|jgi:hypothetical protein|nr:hypothetical protein [Brasilonema angustatum HA4187-MV1]